MTSTGGARQPPDGRRCRLGRRRARAAGHGGRLAGQGLPARPRPRPARGARRVSFSLYRGAVVALVGESGSGKSTVARLLAGQEQPTGGSIRLDGEPVDVSQPPGLPAVQERGPARLPGPVRLAEPRAHRALPPGAPGEAAPGHAVQRTRSAQEVAALLEQVRLTPAEQFLPKYPHELSGGQRQRVSFARALAARPERAAGRRAGVHAGRVDPAGDAEPARRPAPPASSSRCSTSPTTSPRPGTSPTRCSSCTAGRSSSAARPRS